MGSYLPNCIAAINLLFPQCGTSFIVESGYHQSREQFYWFRSFITAQNTDPWFPGMASYSHY
jgi:hypothetical protein